VYSGQPGICRCGDPTRHKASFYCVNCYLKVLPKFKIEDDRRIEFAEGRLCTKCTQAEPEPGEAICWKCLQHGKKRTVQPELGGMPETCMYGWLGEFAKKLQSPPSAAYPAVLAVAAGYGVPNDPRVRSTLYCTIIGVTRSGKSATAKRILDSWVAPPEAQVIRAYPGSEQGLILLLGGKKHKDMKPDDYYAAPRLLVQDEMRMMFGKIAIQNSGLPHALNEMFYLDTFSTAVKVGGHMECAGRLSILGCLTCNGPDEFAEIYGVDTATGLYGRTIFGLVPPGWDFRWETWEAPLENGEPIRRRAKTCRLTAEAFRMADEWRKQNPEEHGDLKELALRVALVSASLNHDSEVSQECMAKALEFMDWQVSIRRKYRPSESDTPAGRCQQAVIRALKKYEGWVEWKTLCTRHSLYKGKDRSADVLNRVKRALIFEGIVEEETVDNSEGKKEKTGRVRLAEHVE